jgi:hypothetical protein
MKHVFLLFTFLHLSSIALQSQTTDQKARQIFKSVTNNEPAYIVFDEYLKDFIIAAYREEETNQGIIHIDKLTNVNGKWRLTKSLETGNGNWEEELSDKSFIVNLDNQRYWCFLSSQSARATQSVDYSFYLVDMNLENIYNLNVKTYSETDKAHRSDISYSDNLKEARVQRKYLDELAKSSGIVYNPTADNTNINSPVNFVEKFEIVNRQLYEKSTAKTIKFKPVFYSKKLIDSQLSLSKKENLKYIINYEYQVGLILFDKALKKYTLIYLTDYWEQNFTFTFKSTNQVVINSSNVKNLIIDLEKFTYNYQ